MLSGNQYRPSVGSGESAGIDLRSPYDQIIPAKSRLLIPLNLKVELRKGTYGRLAPRSGLAIKHFIDVGAGVIDSDYRGNVHVLLFNFGDEDYHIKPGDKIVQLIVEKIHLPPFIVISPDLGQHLNVTERGERGFGSTGY